MNFRPASSGRLSPRLVGLLQEAQEIGAIGPAPLASHLAHATGFTTALDGLIQPDDRIVDLGSGGGIPGLVLAELLPTVRIVLLEGRVQRAARLVECVDRLGLADRVSVLAERAEDAARDPAYRSSFDIAVARGFAAPPVTAECGAPLLVDRGLLCVSEPPSGDVLERWPAEGCSELGLTLERWVSSPFSYVVLRQTGECPEQYPRRVGVPAKRPLF